MTGPVVSPAVSHAMATVAWGPDPADTVERKETQRKKGLNVQSKPFEHLIRRIHVFSGTPKLATMLHNERQWIITS